MSSLAESCSTKSLERGSARLATCRARSKECTRWRRPTSLSDLSAKRSRMALASSGRPRRRQCFHSISPARGFVAHLLRKNPSMSVALPSSNSSRMWCCCELPSRWSKMTPCTKFTPSSVPLAGLASALSWPENLSAAVFRSNCSTRARAGIGAAAPPPPGKRTLGSEPRAPRSASSSNLARSVAKVKSSSEGAAAKRSCCNCSNFSAQTSAAFRGSSPAMFCRLRASSTQWSPKDDGETQVA
mmetsp:Transcript_133868/g.427854  ORF Transcript_133868/g.427854 Transcript_133868/m.427854 type:complete len:243 (+) Transcript_133868:1344-2072(+)